MEGNLYCGGTGRCCNARGLRSYVAVTPENAPGPFPLPIVGNVMQLPKAKPWYRFEEWANKYNNPLTTVWFGRHPTVVLNDAWTASDLMDKRANNYSSRPVFQVPGELMEGRLYNQTMLPYGDRWRLHRRLTVPKSERSKLTYSTSVSAHRPFDLIKVFRPTNPVFWPKTALRIQMTL